MADFVVTNAGWVEAPRSNHGRFATKVLRGGSGGANTATLLEVVDAKAGMTGTPVNIPDWDLIPLPDTDPDQPQSGGTQIDTVIEVDATCALVLGWMIQSQDGVGHEGTHNLQTVQCWQHLMWAIDALGEPGAAVQLGYRIDYNWESEEEPDYQTSTDYDLRWPAHFGIPMGARQVRLPSNEGETDLIVEVGTDLGITFPGGLPPGYSGPDLGGPLGDPNTQNGVMAYFEAGVAPAAGVLRFADGTVVPFTSPGTPLCQPVDLGAGAYWAWLTEDAGELKLAYHQLGVGTTTDVLALPEWTPGATTVTYTLSRLTYPVGSLFAVMRVKYDVDTDPLHFLADQILCTFAGPRALTGWTNVRSRTDVFEYPS